MHMHLGWSFGAVWSSRPLFMFDVEASYADWPVPMEWLLSVITMVSNRTALASGFVLSSLSQGPSESLDGQDGGGRRTDAQRHFRAHTSRSVGIPLLEQRRQTRVALCESRVLARSLTLARIAKSTLRARWPPR